MAGFSFGDLSRYPDIEAGNLFAVDAADRLILDEAADEVVASGNNAVVIIGDRYGALTLGAADLLDDEDSLRVHQDSITGELALANNAAVLAPDAGFTQYALGRELLTGARVVLLQLPRSLEALDQIADAVARWAADDVVLFAGGLTKHMTPAMNEVLRKYFGTVRAGLGRQKARVITAREVQRPGTEPEPTARQFHQDLGLWVCSAPGTFAGTKVDIGTRFLLGFLPRLETSSGAAVDLGCGTGIIAARLAALYPELQVSATDQSAAAVESAAATAAANGLAGHVNAVRDDAMGSFPDASVDLVVCNPPFHAGAAVHAGAALKLFGAAARVLRPGGELLVVYNSHLDYRSRLRSTVGPTQQLGRNRKFTVTRSIRR
ncbi:class I SAM-dependent methyltransferase [Arthrobacter castelli]|uniref:class I SAM-dependent methyltransferase n=1 Tax=Arthrobacter castelli TaxID=271431 RepID=UPI000408F199|nr:methyltransferase [Arthrobacter castelli]